LIAHISVNKKYTVLYGWTVGAIYAHKLTTEFGQKIFQLLSILFAASFPLANTISVGGR